MKSIQEKGKGVDLAKEQQTRTSPRTSPLKLLTENELSKQVDLQEEEGDDDEDDEEEGDDKDENQAEENQAEEEEEGDEEESEVESECPSHLFHVSSATQLKKLGWEWRKAPVAYMQLHPKSENYHYFRPGVGIENPKVTLTKQTKNTKSFKEEEEKIKPP
jgi:hypothetical protein